MRKISKSILLCLTAILLCACSPASKEDVQRYAENKYGAAEYVRTEEIDDRTIRYYFLDEEYGFEYCVTSEAEYSRKEQKVFRDTGLTLSQIPTILGTEPTTEDSVVTYYYFTVNGEEYFLADVLVTVDGAIKWYTNYEEE